MHPNFVCDAAFHSAAVMDYFIEGKYLTASVNKQHKKWLFDLLERMCQNKGDTLGPSKRQMRPLTSL